VSVTGAVVIPQTLEAATSRHTALCYLKTSLQFGRVRLGRRGITRKGADSNEPLATTEIDDAERILRIEARGIRALMAVVAAAIRPLVRPKVVRRGGICAAVPTLTFVDPRFFPGVGAGIYDPDFVVDKVEPILGIVKSLERSVPYAPSNELPVSWSMP